MKNHWEETLAELERIQTEAAQAIRSIKKLMVLNGLPSNDINGEQTEIDPSLPKTYVTSRSKAVIGAGLETTKPEATRDSLAQRMRQVFQQSPTRSFNVAELAKILDGESLKTIGGSIHRLCSPKVRFIKRVSRGRYKLHQQQQQAPPETTREQQP
jgi:hypothetical protein